MRTEVRVYHLDQGTKFKALKVEQFRTLREARERCELWTTAGYIAIPVRTGWTDKVLKKRLPGWGKVQARKILVVRKDRDHINARKRELVRLRKLGLAPPIKHRKQKDP